MAKFNFIVFWFLLNSVSGTTHRQRSYQIILSESAVNPYATLVGTIPYNLTDITICFWVNVESFENNCSDVVSYSLPDETVPVAVAACKNEKVAMYEKDEYNETRVENGLRAFGQWELSCNMKSISRNYFLMMHSSDFRYGTKKGRVDFEIPIRQFGTLFLGDKNGGFRGRISQLNVWDYYLSGEEVVEMSNCKYSNEGNVIAWSQASWQPSGGAIVAPVALPCNLYNSL